MIYIEHTHTCYPNWSPSLSRFMSSYRGVSNTRVSFEMAPVEASRSYLYRNKARKNFQRIFPEAAGKPATCVAILLSNWSGRDKAA